MCCHLKWFIDTVDSKLFTDVNICYYFSAKPYSQLFNLSSLAFHIFGLLDPIHI